MSHKVNPHETFVALYLVLHLLERRSEAFFKPFDLTSAQFNILHCLCLNQGKLDQLALAETLLVVEEAFRSC